MSTNIKTLVDENGDFTLPRTVAQAVAMPDGDSLENKLVSRVQTLTAWNQELLAGTITPNVTLPTPDATKVQEITYLFTAATANATFTAPANWILCGEFGTAGLSAGNSVSFTDLTVGSIYEISFKPVSSSVIRLLMSETPTA